MQRDRHKIWLCLPVGIAVFPGRHAGKPFEHGNKVIVVREDAGGGDLTDFHSGCSVRSVFAFSMRRILICSAIPQP